MLELQPHPARLANPVTGKKDVVAFPLQKQLMMDGKRIGYVSTDQKIRVHLIVHFAEPQKAEIVQWVREQLGEPESVGMVPDPQDLPSEAFLDGVPMDVGQHSDADFDPVPDS